MSLLTVAEARAQVPNALGDAHLQAVIDREEADVLRRFGAHWVAATTISETHAGDRSENLYLRRRILSVATVKERLSLADAQVTLTTTDYFVWADEGILQRLPEGATWGAEVVVDYVPQDDTALRKQVLVELVRLALNRTVYQSENVAGEYSYSVAGDRDLDKQRAEQIRRLGFWEV